MKLLGAYYQGKRVLNYYVGRFADQNLFVILEYDRDIDLNQEINTSSNLVYINLLDNIIRQLNVSYDRGVFATILGDTSITVINYNPLINQSLSLMANLSPAEIINFNKLIDFIQLKLLVNAHQVGYNNFNHRVDIDLPTVKLMTSANKVMSSIFNWVRSIDLSLEADVGGLGIAQSVFRLLKDIDIKDDKVVTSVNGILPYNFNLDDLQRLYEETDINSMLVLRSLLELLDGVTILFEDSQYVAQVSVSDLLCYLSSVISFEILSTDAQMLALKSIILRTLSVVFFETIRSATIGVLGRQLPSVVTEDPSIIEDLFCKPEMVTRVWLYPQEVISPFSMEMLEIYQSQETYVSDGILYIN